MFPHEMQAVMAKILFFIFSILILCFSKVNAANTAPRVSQSPLQIESSLN